MQIMPWATWVRYLYSSFYQSSVGKHPLKCTCQDKFWLQYQKCGIPQDSDNVTCHLNTHVFYTFVLILTVLVRNNKFWLGGSVDWATVCPAGGREFDSGRTNTQGLKITEEKVLPLSLDLQMVKTFKSSWIRTINRRPCLTTLECSQFRGTLKNLRTYTLFEKSRAWSSRCCGRPLWKYSKSTSANRCQKKLNLLKQVKDRQIPDTLLKPWISMRQEVSKCLSTSGAKEQKHTLHTVCWKVYISCLLKRRNTDISFISSLDTIWWEKLLHGSSTWLTSLPNLQNLGPRNPLQSHNSSLWDYLT